MSTNNKSHMDASVAAISSAVTMAFMLPMLIFAFGLLVAASVVIWKMPIADKNERSVEEVSR